MKSIVHGFVVILLFMVLAFPGASRAATNPAVTSPAPGSTLSDVTATFSWTDNGTPVLAWALQVGRALGEDDIYNSGPLGRNTVSAKVSKLPKDGSTIYVRLWWLAKLSLKYADFKYTALTRVLLPKTGQTTCYDSSGGQITCTGTGQDGALQKGAAWPNPRFKDNGNGTVTDNLTGLIWLKNANCFGQVDWQSALNAANGLHDTGNPATSCGLSDGSVAGDWRLPNVRELHSLVDYAFVDPALSNGAGTAQWIEGDAFSDVQSTGYWSSSTYAGSSIAWGVSMFGGVVGNDFKSVPEFVWLCRGGQ